MVSGAPMTAVAIQSGLGNGGESIGEGIALLGGSGPRSAPSSISSAYALKNLSKKLPRICRFTPGGTRPVASPELFAPARREKEFPGPFVKFQASSELAESVFSGSPSAQQKLPKTQKAIPMMLALLVGKMSFFPRPKAFNPRPTVSK